MADKDRLKLIFHGAIVLVRCDAYPRTGDPER
jgi:hypothetical protein